MPFRVSNTVCDFQRFLSIAFHTHSGVWLVFLQPPHFRVVFALKCFNHRLMLPQESTTAQDHKDITQTVGKMPVERLRNNHYFYNKLTLHVYLIPKYLLKSDMNKSLPRSPFLIKIVGLNCQISIYISLLFLFFIASC